MFIYSILLLFAHLLVPPEGRTISTRFDPPAGFTRKPCIKNSFAFYLRNLALKPAGSLVKYYNGAEKTKMVYAAVVDMDIGHKDLQQCADAVMRLRAEFLYSTDQYDKISFTLTNGFVVDYAKWIKGYRVMVSGQETYWKKTAEPGVNYANFRAYLDLIFNYAGTISLSACLHEKNCRSIAIGDVFIVGGSPGHAVIVVDLVENNRGQKRFLLAQSYMPAQDIQVLKNYTDPGISPWYDLPEFSPLYTPEWTFKPEQLKTW
jgi:hypothetical protein